MPQVQLARASHPRAADEVHAGENVPRCYGRTRSACALLINAVASHHRGESPASTRACTTAIIMPPRLTQPQLDRLVRVCQELQPQRAAATAQIQTVRHEHASVQTLAVAAADAARASLSCSIEKARWPSRTTTSPTGRSCCGCTFAPSADGFSRRVRTLFVQSERRECGVRSFCRCAPSGRGWRVWMYALGSV